MKDNLEQIKRDVRFITIIVAVFAGVKIGHFLF